MSDSKPKNKINTELSDELKLTIAIDYPYEVEPQSWVTLKVTGLDEPCPDCVKAKILAALADAGLNCTVEENNAPYHWHDDAEGDRA